MFRKVEESTACQDTETSQIKLLQMKTIAPEMKIHQMKFTVDWTLQEKIKH